MVIVSWVLRFGTGVTVVVRSRPGFFHGFTPWAGGARGKVNNFFKAISGTRYIASLFCKASCGSRLKAGENNLTACTRKRKFVHSVRGLRDSCFHAGFRSRLPGFGNDSNVNVVDSASPRPVIVGSRLNGFTVIAMTGVGGVARLRHSLLTTGVRFSRVDLNGAGRARLVTLLVIRKGGFMSNVRGIFGGVGKSYSVLVLARSNVVTTHSG